MRAILESYDTELAPTEYSPQLSRRLREAEDVLQKTQNHNAEMEVRAAKCHLSYPASAAPCPGVLLHAPDTRTRAGSHFFLYSASRNFFLLLCCCSIQAQLSKAQEETGTLKLQLQRVSIYARALARSKPRESLLAGLAAFYFQVARTSPCS